MAVIVVLGIIWYVVTSVLGWGIPGLSGRADHSGWQAVFLNNGQVYFGSITDVNDNDLVLTNIYYLQVVNRPLQRTQEGQATSTESQQELTLIKLGNELHGPVDQMVINRAQILLTEKLRDDSRVIQAINQYLEDQKNQAKQE